MREVRHSAIAQASSAHKFGIILGTLGRQGSPKVLEVREDVTCFWGISRACVWFAKGNERPLVWM